MSSKTHRLPATAPRFHLRAELRRLLLLALLLPATSPATILYFNAGGQRSITLQVGSIGAAINNVTFDVTNANVAPTPTPVTGVPGGGAPVTVPAGGIQFVISSNRRTAVRLLADSSGGLVCIAGGCGATIIPFNTISWISNNLQGGATAGQDLQSGTFNGSATQQILSVTVAGPNDSFTVTNSLVFSYSNATLYPSGNYSGRVTFTAVAP